MASQTTMNLFSQPHRRFNPLTREWVLVSPQRTQRPWLGQVESPPAETLPTYDPTCYLCPGNVRANGERNPPYTSTFVFDNDFAALLPTSADDASHESDLLRATPERGVCRVICFSPRHDLTLPQMSRDEIRHVVDAWIA
ncbi:MAG: galactose-1-phosphate uridylyltransferase, partial [Anaerolineae bacterium]|nr:galactose-1-phosphate uridylyltransferase [Anaerolineae bacterium]